MSAEFGLRTEEEVEQAVRTWTEQMDLIFDEEFGLCLLPLEMEGYSVARWKPRLGPPASEKGYHGISQDSTYYAMALLRLGEDVERARKILGRVLEAQVRDETSRRHGQIKLVYEAEGDDVLDGNTTFFVSLALIAAVNEYSDLLGDELSARIKDALSLIPPAEYERSLGVSYTNARLGHWAICMAICEMIGDRERFEVSCRYFRYFYDMHMSRGIPERLSTYYLVDMTSLGLILNYVKDQGVLTLAREMMAVFAQELLFFEERQPLPARRTYNQHNGAALPWGMHLWLLGVLRCSASELRGVIEERSTHGFDHAGGWIALGEALLRGAVEPALFAMPAPRQMRGRHVDEDGYTGYFHPRFTLGTFDKWPPLTVGKQHPSDIPVAFAGATKDLAYFGLYSVDAEDNLQTHPGTGEVGTPSRTVRPKLVYPAAQHANVCVVLTNIREMATEMKECGWMLRGLQFTGRLFDAAGAELSGTGTLDAQWVFLAADEYFAGVWPLSHFDPTEGGILESTPTSLRYEFGEDKGLDIFAPNFRADPAADVQGNNLPAGAVIVLASAEETDLDSFRQACLDAAIQDEWYLDGWNVRSGYRDCERRVGISAPGAELRLAYDYLEDKVVERSFNGRPIEPPSELSGVRLGVMPWLYEPKGR